MRQATIEEAVELAGVGLHTGHPCRLRLLAAPVDCGIVFARGTAQGEPLEATIRVHPDSVTDGERATWLASPADPAFRIGTVEHLLASLSAFALDNLRIEVEGDEVPAFDGSAAPLVEALRKAGRETSDAARRPIRLERPLEIHDGDRSIRAEPADRFSVDYAIDFDHPAIGRQDLRFDAMNTEIFSRELAPARTFGFVHELEALTESGLAQGGGLDNAIVLDDRRVLNEGGLRFPDEFVRHKIVDLIGDLALLGRPLAAHVSVDCGGHRLHHALVREIAALGLD